MRCAAYGLRHTVCLPRPSCGGHGCRSHAGQIRAALPGRDEGKVNRMRCAAYGLRHTVCLPRPSCGGHGCRSHAGQIWAVLPGRGEWKVSRMRRAAYGLRHTVCLPRHTAVFLSLAVGSSVFAANSKPYAVYGEPISPAKWYRDSKELLLELTTRPSTGGRRCQHAEPGKVRQSKCQSNGFYGLPQTVNGLRRTAKSEVGPPLLVARILSSGPNARSRVAVARGGDKEMPP